MAIGTGLAILGGTIGGSLLSGVLGSKASKRADKSTQAGIDKATEEQRRQFDITQGNLQPSLEAGNLARTEQLALLGLSGEEAGAAATANLGNLPGQQFLRDRAQKNLLRSSAAIGGLGGGNVRSALVEQGAGFAAQDFNNQFNRLSDIRTAGQNAATNIGQGARSTGTNVGATRFNASQLLGAGAINTAARQGQFGQNFATNVGNLAVQGGNVRATGIQNQNAALQQGIAGVTTGLAQRGLFTSTPPPSSTANIGIT